MKTNTKTKLTIAQRVAALRARFSLSRSQLFIERGWLYLQGLPKDDAGTFGADWKPERGESMHDALNEAEEYLASRVLA